MKRVLRFLIPLHVAFTTSLALAGEFPVVFRVSEGVRPNSIVSLYGEFLTGSPMVRFLRTDGSMAATQPSVQTDPIGHFCRVVFPAIPPGAYQISVNNETGWSARPVVINGAEPRWISEERLYPGLATKLLGRNLDAAEYCGTRRTELRMVPMFGGQAIAITPDAVNPYCVDFTLSREFPVGRYFLEANTHSAEFGNAWVRLDNHSDFPETKHDTVIEVESAPDHPTARALGVTWANDFDWRHVIDAKREFNAKGDGIADDTIPIQRALEQTAMKGGGIVFLPSGDYRVSGLTLPTKCILQGEFRDRTVLMFGQITDQGALVTKGRLHGLSTLTLMFQPTVPAGSQGMLLGGVANHLFLHNIRFQLLRNPDISVKQGPYYVTGNGPMLVTDCQFFLSSRNLWNHQVRDRLTFRNNFVDMHDGLGLCMSSEKLLVLSNELVFHPAPYAGQMNGFFLNEGWMGWNIFNAYIADNDAHNLDGPGDCQPYAADSAWSCFAGAVLTASTNTVEVRQDLNADVKNLDTREIQLVVVHGKGLGQLRRARVISKRGGRPEVVRFTVSPSWDVPPDSTSLISAGSWHVNNVFFRNRASGSKSPYNMYYGGCHDCVDANAASENTEGWYNWGRIGQFPNGNAWHCPVYFSQLKCSVFSGVSTIYKTMGITLRVENETTNYWGVGDYGTEIRDNVIDRAACSNKNQRLAGNAAIATFNQFWRKIGPDTPLILGTLCEGNTIRNSTVGFDLDGSFDFAIRGTKYLNCPNPVHDRGYRTVLLQDEP